MSSNNYGVHGIFKYLKYLKGAGAEMVMATLFGAVTGIASGLGIPLVIKVASDKVFNQPDVSPLVIALFCMLPFIVMTVRGISSIISSYFIAFCGQKIVQEIRVLIFKKMQRLPLSYFHHIPPSDLISRSINSTTIIQNTLMEISHDLIKQPVTLLGAVGFLIYLCFRQANLAILMLFLLAIPVIILPIRKFGRKLREKSSKMQSETAKIINNLNHNLAAIKEIRAFCLESYSTSKYRLACHDFSDAFLKVVKYNVLISPMVEIIASLGVGIAMFYLYEKGIKADIFLSLCGALYISYEPVKRIGWLNGKIQEAMAGIDRIEDILNASESIKDLIYPAKVGRLRGRINFDNVKFSYADDKNIFNGMNLELESAKIYAIAGHSGIGKSTLANLIMRFYDVTAGSVSIDGIDVRDMAVKDLRKNIAIVPQEPVLVNDTVFNNIIWGDLSASRDDVIAAAKKAFAHDFIEKLENGYDTIIGEDGNFLSGGQKQRLALTRAFLRDSQILILDEATSALDSDSERKVYKAIKELVKNRTVVIISHRFSMMSIVDQVVVLDNGKVAEMGTPEELLNLKTSIYKHLYDNQNLKK
ncbi:MAG: ABC transporter ATP-binding protein/permease [Puniceicoccales bacterium]|jgi:subfamily B ATP-binding cassette protein MsbA|nr:ABC transporter ATP-binding protein/permease [Puniceicoccales bacterium]